jgi:hypothetical protein
MPILDGSEPVLTAYLPGDRDTPPEDILWTLGSYGPDNTDSWTPHIVRSRTAQFVNVDRRHASSPGAGQHTVRLDRAELETKSCAWSRSRGAFFYTTAFKRQREASKPETKTVMVTLLGDESSHAERIVTSGRGVDPSEVPPAPPPAPQKTVYKFRDPDAPLFPKMSDLIKGD